MNHLYCLGYSFNIKYMFLLIYTTMDYLLYLWTLRCIQVMNVKLWKVSILLENRKTTNTMKLSRALLQTRSGLTAANWLCQTPNFTTEKTVLKPWQDDTDTNPMFLHDVEYLKQKIPMVARWQPSSISAFDKNPWPRHRRLPKAHGDVVGQRTARLPYLHMSRTSLMTLDASLCLTLLPFLFHICRACGPCQERNWHGPGEIEHVETL